MVESRIISFLFLIVVRILHRARSVKTVQPAHSHDGTASRAASRALNRSAWRRSRIALCAACCRSIKARMAARSSSITARTAAAISRCGRQRCVASTFAAYSARNAVRSPLAVKSEPVAAVARPPRPPAPGGAKGVPSPRNDRNGSYRPAPARGRAGIPSTPRPLSRFASNQPRIGGNDWRHSLWMAAKPACVALYS